MDPVNVAFFSPSRIRVKLRKEYGDEVFKVQKFERKCALI